MILNERKGTFSKCSTQVDIPESMYNTLKEYQNKIPDDDLHEYGKEDDFHIIVLYGILEESSLEEIKKIFKNINGIMPKIKAKLDKVTLFDTNDEFDVIKVDVISDDLIKLNSLFRNKLNYKNDYPEYHPHLTLAYVKKGKATKYNCDLDFKDIEMTFDSIQFCNRDGKKTVIPLASKLDIKESLYKQTLKEIYGYDIFKKITS